MKTSILDVKKTRYMHGFENRFFYDSNYFGFGNNYSYVYSYFWGLELQVGLIHIKITYN